ncbi:MAG: hypothetical protein AB1Z98_01100, partial [Nannocystaceae bacterium]
MDGSVNRVGAATGHRRTGLRTARPWLLAALGLAGGCRGEHVIGILDGGVESTASDGSTQDSTGSLTLGTDSTGDASGGATSSPTGDGPAQCGAPPGHTVCDFDDDPFHAIGLGCEGAPTDTQPIVAPRLESADPDAWRVFREYGNPQWTPTEGSRMLALTTGTLPPVDDSDRIEIPLGVTDAADGSNDNPDGVALPAPVVPQPGSQGGAGGEPFVDCDGVGDCSDSLPTPWDAGGPANDLVWLAFDIDVPPDTFGYRVDLAWFSAELPARHTEPGTDLVVWWQSSEAFTGNVATLAGAPLSAFGVADWVAQQGLLGNDPPLFGTGFDGTTGLPCDVAGSDFVDCPRGGATGWLELRGPSLPGERMSITVAVLDLLDDHRDTTVLLDDWR